jgi:hypothetical protein
VQCFPNTFDGPAVNECLFYIRAQSQKNGPVLFLYRPGCYAFGKFFVHMLIPAFYHFSFQCVTALSALFYRFIDLLPLFYRFYIIFL